MVGVVDETATALVPYSDADARARAGAWASLDDGARKRGAVEAARDHDAAALWELTQTWLILHGRKGASVSLRTLHSYQEALLPRPPLDVTQKRVSRAKGAPLLDAWAGENLLHPGREAGTRWLRGLETAGCSPSTVRVYLAGARALYAALRGAGATTVDPLKDLHPAPDPVARHEKRQPYDEDAVAALIAGLRVSEMTALHWGDVDLARRRLVVRSGKGGKKRTVPLSSTLIIALTEAARGRLEEACVLPHKDRLAVWYRLRALARCAGVTPMGVHSLRHYAGTRLTRENKGNLRPAQKMLGHESIVTTEVYAAWSDESLADQLTAW